ncbi:MAG: DUF805 domain-containing protein [Novosphingobium sp.]|nr:DUF805 domain-containing protein [Novosphingobium sp.]
MEWMILPYRRYFEFGGRSRRREYWMFVLFWVLVVAVLEAVFGTRTATHGSDGFSYGVAIEGGIGDIIYDLLALVSFIPGLAVSIRRLHDQDRTGWLMLMAIIPLFGWFALLVMMCLEGTRGPNRFGSDPKGRIDPRDVFE